MGTSRRKRSEQLLRLQHCICLGQVQSCNVLFRLGVSKIKVFAGCRGLFTKSRPVSSADSVGLQLVCHWHTLTPRRAQNLLAGCIFDRPACRKCFYYFRLLFVRIIFCKFTFPDSYHAADKKCGAFLQKVPALFQLIFSPYKFFRNGGQAAVLYGIG